MSHNSHTHTCHTLPPIVFPGGHQVQVPLEDILSLASSLAAHLLDHPPVAVGSGGSAGGGDDDDDDGVRSPPRKTRTKRGTGGAGARAGEGAAAAGAAAGALWVRCMVGEGEGVLEEHVVQACASLLMLMLVLVRPGLVLSVYVDAWWARYTNSTKHDTFASASARKHRTTQHDLTQHAFQPLQSVLVTLSVFLTLCLSHTLPLSLTHTCATGGQKGGGRVKRKKAPAPPTDSQPDAEHNKSDAEDAAAAGEPQEVDVMAVGAADESAESWARLLAGLSEMCAGIGMALQHELCE